MRGIVHQLNNTLVPILTLGSLLSDTLEETEAAGDLNLIVVSAMKARNLVQMLIVEIDRLECGARASLTVPEQVGDLVPFHHRTPS